MAGPALVRALATDQGGLGQPGVVQRHCQPLADGLGGRVEDDHQSYDTFSGSE